jgi:flagellar M-ring protein FliF
MAQQALAWLGNYWSTLGVLGMAGFSLLMLRSMVRSGPTVSATSFGPLPLPTPEPERQETPAEETPKSRFRRRLGTGPSMRDELATMVREDPDAAANILKGWIGNAG